MKCADLLDSWLPVKKGSSSTVNLQLRQDGTQGSSPQGICFDELWQSLVLLCDNNLCVLSLFCSVLHAVLPNLKMQLFIHFS